MNWKYIVGKSLFNFGNAILCSKFMPLTRAIPLGISYPYDIKRFCQKTQIKTIFDVGANIGQTSLFLNCHFPEAEIFAFEPVSETYETLKHNLKQKSNIKPFNYALGSKQSQKTIRLRENSELNTLVDDSKESFSKVETVKITTIDNFIRNSKIAQIDILKMDVQGYELEVLYGAEYYLSNNLVSFIYAEIGFDKSNKECQDFDDLHNFLTKSNFRFSGFYEVFRWGENKKFFGFCNALFVNCNL